MCTNVKIHLNIDRETSVLQKNTLEVSENNRAQTFVFTQEVDAFLQDGGLVHLPGVAWQHGTKFLDEDIELVSPLLLRLVTGHATKKHK